MLARAADAVVSDLLQCMACSQRRILQKKPSRGRAVQRCEFVAVMQPGCSEDPSHEDDDGAGSLAGQDRTPLFLLCQQNVFVYVRCAHGDGVRFSHKG
jgi:hypothetical protein